MIYVTHDQVEAMTMAGRICTMDGGRVAQVGAPLEVYRRPTTTFVAGFLGNQPMNLLPAAATGGAIRVGDAVVATLFHAREGAVTLGIRPEDLEIAEDGPIRGEVVAAEPLGAETILALRLPGVECDLLVRAGRNLVAALGGRLGLRAPAGALHLFDAASGRRVEPKGGTA